MLVKNNIIKSIKTPPTVFFETLPENLEENFKKTKFLLKEMNTLSRKNKIKFVVVIIPSKIQVSDRHWEEYQKSYENVSTSRYMPQKTILDFCIKNKILCIDLFPEFLKIANKGDYYFEIDGHWNEKGHELASNLIYEELRDEGTVG